MDKPPCFQADGMSGIASKHSFPGGSKVAAKWLKTQFEVTGAACRFTPFLEDFASNVVCRYNATWRILVLCSYDSPGSFGTRRNDDASGTISILSVARWIKQPGMTFRSNVELVSLAAKNRMYWDDRHTLWIELHESALTTIVMSDFQASSSSCIDGCHSLTQHPRAFTVPNSRPYSGLETDKSR
ncbi:hypothetical protein EDC04DRAFT_1002837 [Pisolithus marmoratus]|nr:hypothetical protein EDC04DRAFT_1002837 [Pisolithus marmoratus]